jgi:hypothetical protein
MNEAIKDPYTNEPLDDESNEPDDSGFTDPLMNDPSLDKSDLDPTDWRFHRGEQEVRSFVDAPDDGNPRTEYKDDFVSTLPNSD